MNQSFQKINMLLVDIGQDFLGQLKSGSTPTKYLEKYDKGGTAAFQDVFTLLMKIGFFGAVLMLICGLILWAWPSSAPNDKAQAKKKITWILVGVFLLCMAVSIVGWVYTAGTGATGP